MNHFSNISKDELELINGGGLAGAAAGYLVGVVVGGILAVPLCQYSCRVIFEKSC